MTEVLCGEACPEKIHTHPHEELMKTIQRAREARGSESASTGRSLKTRGTKNGKRKKSRGARETMWQKKAEKGGGV